MDGIKNYVIEQLQYFKLTRDDYRILTIALAVFGLWGLPVILGGLYHQDDIYRAITGNYDWYGLGRPLAQEAARFFSGSGLVLIDTAPLTQIISLLFLSLSSLLLYRTFYSKYELRIPFIVTLLILNPFFLYNLYYRFDSIGMGLGILLVCVAFSGSLKNKEQILVSTAMLIGALCCYQPVVNLFIALVGLELLVIAHRKMASADIIKYITVRAATFVFAFLLYYLTIGLIVSSRTTRSSLLSLNSDGFLKASEKIGEFVTYTLNLYYQTEFLLVTVLLIILGLGLILKKNVNPPINYWVLAASVFAMCFSLFGPLFLLNNSLVHFRTIPTAMVGFVWLVTFLVVRYKRLDSLALFPIILVISLSYQIGNAYKNQRKYDENLVRNIAYELSKFTFEYDEVLVTGKSSTPLFVQNAVSESAIISDFVKPATGWQLDGLIMNQGVEEITFRWGSEKRERVKQLSGDLCSSSGTLIVTKKFNIYRYKQLVHVSVGENKDTFCKDY